MPWNHRITPPWLTGDHVTQFLWKKSQFFRTQDSPTISPSNHILEYSQVENMSLWRTTHGFFFFFLQLFVLLANAHLGIQKLFVSRSWKENVLKNENAEEKSIVKWVRKGTTWSSRKGKTMMTVKIYWLQWFNKGEEWIEACGKLWGQRN